MIATSLWPARWPPGYARMFKRDNLGAHASNKKDQVCNHRFPRAHTHTTTSTWNTRATSKATWMNAASWWPACWLPGRSKVTNLEHKDERCFLVASPLAARMITNASNKFERTHTISDKKDNMDDHHFVGGQRAGSQDCQTQPFLSTHTHTSNKKNHVS